MKRDFRRSELPGQFAKRYRPVRVHPHEKGLAAFVLDDYGLGFFRRLSTGAAVPDEAVWSVACHPAVARALRLVPGRREDALGYVVCQVPEPSREAAAYPIPTRLSYRAKVAIAALQALLLDLADDPGVPACAEVIRRIEQRIEQLRA